MNFTGGTLSDASWHTATATGALSFMEYGRVEDFADVYQTQDLFTRLEEQTLEDFLQLQSYVAYGFDPDKVKPEDAKAAATDVRKTLSHVIALGDVGRGLNETYVRALGGK